MKTVLVVFAAIAIFMAVALIGSMWYHRRGGPWHRDQLRRGALETAARKAAGYKYPAWLQKYRDELGFVDPKPGPDHPPGDA